MNVLYWFEMKFQNLKWFDVSFIKASTFFFALMLANLWVPILALDWKLYLMGTVIFAARPFYLVYLKPAINQREKK